MSTWYNDVHDVLSTYTKVSAVRIAEQDGFRGSVPASVRKALVRWVQRVKETYGLTCILELLEH